MSVFSARTSIDQHRSYENGCILQVSRYLNSMCFYHAHCCFFSILDVSYETCILIFTIFGVTISNFRFKSIKDRSKQNSKNNFCTYVNLISLFGVHQFCNRLALIVDLCEVFDIVITLNFKCILPNFLFFAFQKYLTFIAQFLKKKTNFI